MKFLVTGGAGFIGSHLVELLVEEGHDVTVVDNLSTGRLEFLKDVMGNPHLRFIRADLTSPEVAKEVTKGADAVVHLAANPEVRIGSQSPESIYLQNVQMTYNVLEGMRANGVKAIAFASSSTVYGEASVIPTPEDYGPCYPISVYGGSKLASEGLISGYAFTFDWTAVSYRLANVVGPRSTHGVIYDFINKLRKDPTRLEVLGDGSQSKSYVHVSDTVRAMYQLFMKVLEKGVRYEAFNIGTPDRISVLEIAKIVAETMGLSPQIYTTGGVDGGRGWKGDVKIMQLSIEKAVSWGWSLQIGSSRDVIRRAVTEVLSEFKA
ncbi:NAD-dependent epimerase/dehydratase family protein [Acidilobus sp.]|uniref:NAD-dependent epimerase/dehydratase family protein n=1 Tax=Acidilobus sp. TaxID=1872109 RepID=UPI003D00885D